MDQPACRFVQRVNAELQIFGMVAISLFTVQNLMGTLPSSTFTKSPGSRDQ